VRDRDGDDFGVVEPDEATRKRLRALGYLCTRPKPSTSPTLPCCVRESWRKAGACRGGVERVGRERGSDEGVAGRRGRIVSLPARSC